MRGKEQSEEDEKRGPRKAALDSESAIHGARSAGGRPRGGVSAPNICRCGQCSSMKISPELSRTSYSRGVPAAVLCPGSGFCS